MHDQSANHAEERIAACFKALATGDTVAKQTETLPYRGVRTWYPEGIQGFEGSPGEVIPRYRGKRYQWKIGETTDDTEQTLAVARAILMQRDVTHAGHEYLRRIEHLIATHRSWSLRMRSTYARRTVRDLCGGWVVAAISAGLDGWTSAGALESALTASQMAEALRSPTRAGSITDSLAQMHADLSIESTVASRLYCGEVLSERTGNDSSSCDQSCSDHAVRPGHRP